MKKNINVAMKNASAMQNCCVYSASEEGGEFSVLLPMVFSCTSGGW